MNKCLICESTDLKEILDLGIHPNSDTFITKNFLKNTEPLEQLICCLCKKCGMVQNRNLVNEHQRYNLYDYSYTSANSKFAKKHWDDLANFLFKLLKLNNKNKLLEIGSNDGYLAKNFQNKNINSVCVDASKKMVGLSKSIGLKSYVGIFNFNFSKILKINEGKFDLVIANNVFNHSNNPNDFLKGVKNLLTKNGSFVFEVLYWKDIVKNKRFDQVYHEHISHFTAKSINKQLNSNKFRIHKIYRNDYHGGSLRVIAKRFNKKDKNMTKELKKFITAEKNMGLFDLKIYSNFQKYLYNLKIQFNNKIFELLSKGYKIIGIGAGAKSNTFLNFMRLDHNSVIYITDVSKHKINKYMPLSRIPIKSDKILKKYKKVYALILSWNMDERLIKKLKKINKNIKIISQKDFKY